MKNTKYKIFVDFDGTVTEEDVGNSIFSRFLPPELLKRGWHSKILDEWKAGRITSRECLSIEFEHAVFSEEELKVELERFTLTAGFAETARYCKSHGFPLIILSDGLDYYIKYILCKYGLGDVGYRANHMYFHNGSAGIDFPYEDRGCGRCANCKRWHIDTLSTGGDHVVYVGDGYSDRYAIHSADVIFARYDLAGYCDKKGISYFPYDNFYAVIDYIKDNHEKV